MRGRPQFESSLGGRLAKFEFPDGHHLVGRRKGRVVHDRQMIPDELRRRRVGRRAREVIGSELVDTSDEAFRPFERSAIVGQKEPLLAEHSRLGHRRRALDEAHRHGHSCRDVVLVPRVRAVPKTNDGRNVPDVEDLLVGPPDPESRVAVN